MNFEPIVLTRAERLSDEPVSRWRKLRHYGPQIVVQVAKATARWVRLLPRRTWRLAWAHWMMSLTIIAAVFISGVIYWVTVDTRSEEAAKRATTAKNQQTIDKNQKVSLKYAEDWKAAFLGDRQAICFESCSSDTLIYTVACHIGAKGTDPKKVLECHEFGCEYKDL